MKSDIITGAAYWACYLINGDASGMEDHEIALCDEWFAANGSPNIVDVGESYFSWSYGFHTGDPEAKGGDLADYTVLYH